ncbi:MAG TPA: squalene/phytoene synthase family protein [Bacteroidales bacterium]|nr:squalene/phytoene synthase family protein [Bacteroidales bacterium]HRZ48081.1 squalene/phytoene synthase family protein [Bacteroidales bacterium]
MTDLQQKFDAIRFEEITHHPNILIAAAFWDEERYQAARECYRIMRYIDDLVDDHKSANRQFLPNDRTQFTGWVEGWLEQLKAQAGTDPAHRQLLATIDQFRIPLWPFADFARAMIYDIHHDGFPTIKAFLNYAEGASLAPASVFVHLCGLQKHGDGYELPPFDVRTTAMPCAMFSYLVHVVRDFMTDHRNHLNYFPLDLMQQHGLTLENLARMAHGAPLSEGFREMMRSYKALAGKYLQETQEMKARVSPLLEPNSRVSLEVVFSLYLMVYERIDPDHGTFSPEELVPTPAETRQRVWEVVEGAE